MDCRRAGMDNSRADGDGTDGNAIANSCSPKRSSTKRASEKRRAAGHNEYIAIFSASGTTLTAASR